MTFSPGNLLIHRKLKSETEFQKKQRKQQDSEKQRQTRTFKVSTIQGASQAHLQACKDGPDYVCYCCHRLMYRQTVLKFISGKYGKVPDTVMSNICHPEFTCCKPQNNTWICTTCDYAQKRGNLPAQAKANNLRLDSIPEQLSELNSLEVHLISLRIPFMKMVALATGKQRSIHGPTVNVPTDLSTVCSLLPRLPSQTQMVPMKLKRKLSYKGHYMYEYVRPDKVLNALKWLKTNNILYKDISVHTDWVYDAAQDDGELWQALISSQRCSSQVQQSEDDSNHSDQDMLLDDESEEYTINLIHVCTQCRIKHTQ